MPLGAEFRVKVRIEFRVRHVLVIDRDRVNAKRTIVKSIEVLEEQKVGDLQNGGDSIL